MVQAKCRVTRIVDWGTCREVYLTPVWDPDPASPNHSWSKATPDGEIRLKLTNPGAYYQFKVGDTHLLSFEAQPA